MNGVETRGVEEQNPIQNQSMSKRQAFHSSGVSKEVHLVAPMVSKQQMREDLDIEG